MDPKFFLDNEMGPVGPDDVPMPTEPPDDVYERAAAEPSFGTVAGARERARQAAAAVEALTAEQLAGSVHASPEWPDVALPQVDRPAGIFAEGAFGAPPEGTPRNGNGLPVVDDTVPGPAPIEIDEQPFADVEDPGSLRGEGYSAAFTLGQLREAAGTDRYVYEARRIRSASPCRTCQHGTEFYGVAALKSQTWTGIARRILCSKFKKDVTENVILACGGYEADAAKVEQVLPIADVERDLRARFGLTPRPASPYDAEEEAEERAYLARALGKELPPAPAPTVQPLWEPGDEVGSVDYMLKNIGALLPKDLP